MNVCFVGEVNVLFFGDIEQIFSGLLKKLLVGDYFGVVVPVPDLDSMAGGVGDYGFSLKGRMISKKNCFFWVDFCHLEFVDTCYV